MSAFDRAGIIVRRVRRLRDRTGGTRPVAPVDPCMVDVGVHICDVGVPIYEYGEYAGWRAERHGVAPDSSNSRCFPKGDAGLLTPARHGLVGSNPARITPAGSHLREASARRARLAGVILPPARYRSACV